MDETGTRGRGSGSEAPTRSWWHAAPERRAAGEALPELLARGAPAHGFRGEVWTCERVARLILREFGVSYHPAHVSRIVRALGLFPYESLLAERTSARRRPSNAGSKRDGLP